MTPIDQPFQTAAGGGGGEDTAIAATDADVSAGISLLSETSLDVFWSDLEGELVPDDPSAYGPFDTGLADAELWSSYAEIDITIDVTVTLTETSSPLLLPFESGTVAYDPFMVPAQDWCTCSAYDPMAVGTDWTTDGYVTFEDPFMLPGWDTAVTDAGAYYDSWDPGAGYWDTGSYYDTTSDLLAGPENFGTWDDLGSAYGYDTGGFDTGLYDTGAYDTGTYDAMSTWDPTAGDAAHDAFIDTITEDYSSSYADPTDWSAAADESQFWMDEYNAAEDLSWDAWNNSVDASIAGDTVGAYEWNQQSLDYGSYADDAWDYSSDAWSTSDW